MRNEKEGGDEIIEFEDESDWIEKIKFMKEVKRNERIVNLDLSK